jgi:BirA family transcriptional regulator, biotin operon repressor / biotin---[acetyl-CoA-carboxylase] ligase
VIGPIGRVIHVLDTVDSTQAALGTLARAGAPEGTVVTARHQTAGRGRHGHRWWDAPGDSLLLSILLKPRAAPAAIPPLCLVAGLAVTDALQSGASVAGRLRWPNDVLVGGRKLCGILAQAVFGSGHPGSHVVLGIGINVNQTAFPRDLADAATSLRLVTGRSMEIGQLQAAVLGALDRRYRQWLAAGFEQMRGEWGLRASTIGQPMRTADGRVGIAVDVAEDGALLVETGDGVRTRVMSVEALGAGEAEGDAARP